MDVTYGKLNAPLWHHINVVNTQSLASTSQKTQRLYDKSLFVVRIVCKV
jgi:hypothetical protein